ncbi:MAG TPA: DUF6491 family protein [Allosphingosinicella sp.]|nr:DUF6491 family protein [Allosphingosinicella sp.]
MKAFFAVIAACLLLPACAEENDPVSASRVSNRSDCFHADNVNSFTPAGDRFVDVRVSRRQQYRLELAGYCPDVDWSQRIALRTIGGSPWICRGMEAEILLPDRGIGPQRCLVTGVRRLSAAEIEAQRRR